MVFGIFDMNFGLGDMNNYTRDAIYGHLLLPQSWGVGKGNL